jgi:hypothetical protein
VVVLAGFRFTGQLGVASVAIAALVATGTTVASAQSVAPGPIKTATVRIATTFATPTTYQNLFTKLTCDESATLFGSTLGPDSVAPYPEKIYPSDAPLVLPLEILDRAQCELSLRQLDIGGAGLTVRVNGQPAAVVQGSLPLVVSGDTAVDIDVAASKAGSPRESQWGLTTPVDIFLRSTEGTPLRFEPTTCANTGLSSGFRAIESAQRTEILYAKPGASCRFTVTSTADLTSRLLTWVNGSLIAPTIAPGSATFDLPLTSARYQILVSLRPVNPVAPKALPTTTTTTTTVPTAPTTVASGAPVKTNKKAIVARKTSPRKTGKACTVRGVRRGGKVVLERVC